MAKKMLGVFGSDQVNLAEMRISASALLRAEETQLKSAAAAGLPIGMPANIQHDMHRLVGWSSTLGHLIDGSMVRVVGVILEAESDREKAALDAVADKYWARHHGHDIAALQSELADRVSPAEFDHTTRYLRIEAFVATRAGIAAELYPELYEIGRQHVDKDGLVDYRFLVERLKVLQPGVFLDEQRQLLLFAHRFFRRSLSHRNKLNEYFLRTYTQMAMQDGLRPRLRLDPDLVGHPSTHHGLLELEHWHGPLFNDDIESIPSGVTVHKATERTRYFEGVDKTHIWWKAAESRGDENASDTFRTFEVEELIDNPSAGLPDETFGCRYAHAEYSLAKTAITHFDGAIRAYPAEAYLQRIDLNIDRAGKHAGYTKLFRVDGSMAVQQWKRLLSDFFRGNPLIPEYLGGSGLENPFDAASQTEEAAEAEAMFAQEALSVFVQRRPGPSTSSLDIQRCRVRLPDGSEVAAVETGLGAVEEVLRARINLAAVASLRKNDGLLQLPRLYFAIDDRFPASMHETVELLCAALREDVQSQQLCAVAMAFAWPQDGLLTTLSIRGPAQLVPGLLDRLFHTVDATAPASAWVEALASLVRELSPARPSCEDLHGVLDGVLTLRRAADAHADVLFPTNLLSELRSRGLASPAQRASEQGDSRAPSER